jgi:hypothetical protein
VLDQPVAEADPMLLRHKLDQIPLGPDGVGMTGEPEAA